MVSQVVDKLCAVANPVLQTIESVQGPLSEVKTLFLRTLEAVGQIYIYQGQKMPVCCAMARQFIQYTNLIEVAGKGFKLFSAPSCYSAVYLGNKNSNEDCKKEVEMNSIRYTCTAYSSAEGSPNTLPEQVFQKVTHAASFFLSVNESIGFVAHFYKMRFSFYGQMGTLTFLRFIEPLNGIFNETVKLWNGRAKWEALAVSNREKVIRPLIMTLNFNEKVSSILKIAFHISLLVMAFLGATSFVGITVPYGAGIKLALSGTMALLGLASYFWDKLNKVEKFKDFSLKTAFVLK